MAKRSSKVLEETVTEMPDGRTVYCGSQGDVLRITVKCAYTPSVEMGKSEAEDAAVAADKAVHKAVTDALYAMPELESRNIVETDMTTVAVQFGKPYKMRYTMYVVPRCSDDVTLWAVVEAARVAAESALAAKGFRISEKREGHRGKSKKLCERELEKK